MAGVATRGAIHDHPRNDAGRLAARTATLADIFVSYTSSDSEWAKWIATDLRALGHSPHVHEWEIGPGHDILAWMEQHHAAADHVLCVVSDAYLKAPYSTLERNAAVWRAAKERADFVLFVMVRPCPLPALVAHFRRCEVFDLPEAAARQRFRDFMTARQAPAAIVFPGHATAESNITIAVPHHFMGRDEAMAEIEATLARCDGRAAITALHGMRGVGKTVLAVAYADKHKHDYRATWWIRAETADTMRTDLAALGYRMGWAGDADSQDAALARTADRLRREGEGILLIFDNAPDRDSIAPFLPPGGAAHVLITSNAHAWREVAEAVTIRVWPREIGAAYLLARTRPASPPPLVGGGRGEGLQAAAEALSDALDGLPLAHEMAASVLRGARPVARRLPGPLRRHAGRGAGRRGLGARRLPRPDDGGEDVRPGDRGGGAAPSGRRTPAGRRRPAAARADPAVPVLGRAGDAGRRAGYAAGGPRAGAGGGGAAALRAGRAGGGAG